MLLPQCSVLERSLSETCLLLKAVLQVGAGGVYCLVVLKAEIRHLDLGRVGGIIILSYSKINNTLSSVASFLHLMSPSDFFLLMLPGVLYRKEFINNRLRDRKDMSTQKVSSGAVRCNVTAI